MEDDKYISIHNNTIIEPPNDLNILMYNIDEINDKYYKKYMTLAIIQKNKNKEAIHAYMCLQSEIELFTYSEALASKYGTSTYISKYLCNMEIKRHYVITHIKQYILEGSQMSSNDTL